ncbi:ATP-dependent RNA helicase [Savitreella phatthalungensis]
MALEPSRKRKRPAEKSAKLKWRSSDVSALTGSMEGFLGLEEVDGVEVETQEFNGMKRYSFKKDLIDDGAVDLDQLEFDADFVDDQEDAQEYDIQHEDDDDDESDEFHGFHDGDEEGTNGGAAQTVAQAVNTIAHPTRNAFGLLAEDDEDESPVLAGWADIALHDKLLKALSKLEFTTPTEIQRLAIPAMLAGENVIGKAATGSGKTLAFGLPIIEEILGNEMSRSSRYVSALVMAPTRELAQQITQHLESVGKYAGINVVSVTGGLSIQKQRRLLQRPTDIIVATPGRLWELMQTSAQESAGGKGELDLLDRLSHLRFLVLDEADRVLQEGHFKEVRLIVDKLPPSKDRQTCVFSATFKKELQGQLARGRFTAATDVAENETESMEYLLRKLRFGKNPRFFDADPTTSVASNVAQGMVECSSAMDKDYHLYYVLLRYPCRALVFTNSIQDVQRLTELLTLLELPAIGLHGNKQQKSRLKALERFRNAPRGILVASDIAARGLDIPSVDLVIHYHLPRSPDLYVHRAGRTGRASARGVSLALCSPQENGALRKLAIALGLSQDGDGSNSGKKSRKPPMKAFPEDLTHLSSCKPRVNLARKVLSLQKQQGKLQRDLELVGGYKKDVVTPANKQDKSQQKKNKTGGKNAWLAEAADDLGLNLSDIDSDKEDGLDDDDDDNSSRRAKKQKQKRQNDSVRGDGASTAANTREARKRMQGELAALRVELKDLVNKPIRTGFSTRYATKGSDNVAHRLVIAQLEAEGGSVTSSVNDRFIGASARSALEALLNE